MTADPLFTGIWASLPLPALLLDGAGGIIAANPAAETFLNTSSRSLIGLRFNHRLAQDVGLPAALARVGAHQSPVTLNDVEVSFGDRPSVLCTAHIAPMQDNPDTLLLILSPREIADRMGRAMGAKSAAKSAIGMAEMLAHEIKNPLAGISGAAQLLAMGLPPEDQELTGLIVEETRRIVKLLAQVEQFGNLRPPERQPVNLHDALDRARRSALMGFAARMVIIEDYDPSLPLTWADPDQLMQVFLNLIRNAAEAAKGQTGTIRLRSYYDQSLRVRRRDGAQAALPLTVEIIDDGPGIPPDLVAQIFEPFVSGRENGTGLGLALVSKIIADHDGWISVDSVPGRTVFRLSLPLVPKDRKEP
ncbi:MAG: ATP-binding protein [Paracoccaceae bacterium]